MTGDTTGRINFFDSALKLLHWFNNSEQFGCLVSISFAHQQLKLTDRYACVHACDVCVHACVYACKAGSQYAGAYVASVKPGSQYDAGAYVASVKA